MTKHDARDSGGGRQAGAEIEVTPEMIEAGLEELYQHRFGSDLRYVLEVVYRAMAYSSVSASLINSSR